MIPADKRVETNHWVEYTILAKSRRFRAKWQDRALVPAKSSSLAVQLEGSWKDQANRRKAVSGTSPHCSACHVWLDLQECIAQMQQVNVVPMS